MRGPKTLLLTTLLCFGQWAAADSDANQRMVDGLRELRVRVEKGDYAEGIGGLDQLKQILSSSDHADLRTFAANLKGTPGMFARDHVVQMVEQALQILTATTVDTKAALTALNQKAKAGPVTSDDLVSFRTLVSSLNRREFDLLVKSASEVSGMFAQMFLVDATQMVITALSPHNSRFGRTCGPSFRSR